MTTPRILAAALALVLAATPLFAAGPRAGHESPEAVFRTFVAACTAGAWNDAFVCYESASGNRLLASIVLNANARVRLAGEDRKGEWAGIVSRHGLRLAHIAAGPAVDADEAFALIVAAVEDKAACFQDVMTFVARLTGRSNRAFEGRLADVHIEGDHATAVVVHERAGQERRIPFSFRRLDESWFILLE